MHFDMDELIRALREYGRIKKTTASGERSFPLEQAKRDAENALLEIIDRAAERLTDQGDPP